VSIPFLGEFVLAVLEPFGCTISAAAKTERPYDARYCQPLIFLRPNLIFIKVAQQRRMEGTNFAGRAAQIQKQKRSNRVVRGVADLQLRREPAWVMLSLNLSVDRWFLKVYLRPKFRSGAEKE